ncbi:hypothetical protein K435DRAFT_764688 [Dendrothele bispora CBS 962.96]|uniref:F-box domain-containing protein n=1 Tax=Dendrothele bispora (strain CBS 962.96) TaxID=1314807 RepID=A0A4S8L8N1_DENBC|nr:hypothetical protein K435DRAFT_764688 [Dendrothele bispora CBS 962.96]
MRYVSQFQMFRCLRSTAIQIDDKKDLKVLRTVNSDFCSLLDPILFSTIQIRLEDTKVSDAFEKLKVLSRDPSRISPHVQKLDFRSPVNSQGEGNGLMKTLGLQKSPKVQKKASLLLLKAIQSWKNLCVVNFRYWNDFPELWRILESEKIHLQDITVYFSTDQAFLQYLASYSGLVHLRTHQILYTRSSITSYFLTKALPKHTGSLQTLDLYPIEEGSQWSFGKHSLPILSKCLELRSLSVCVDADDIHAPNSKEDVVTMCLNLAHTLPRLSTLTIDPARGQSKRFPRQRTCVPDAPYRAHERKTYDEIVTRVSNFKPPLASKTSTFEVIIDRQSYKIQVDKTSSSGVVAAYRPIPELSEIV